MKYDDIIKKVSDNTGIADDIVNKAYKAFWLYIRDTIQKLPLKDSINESDFLTLRTNFNIPSLGKLCLSYDRYVGVKERFNYIKKLRKRNEKIN